MNGKKNSKDGNEAKSGNENSRVDLKPIIAKGIIAILIVLMLVTATVVGFNSYFNRPVAATEIPVTETTSENVPETTATGTTVAEETGKITYEEFQEQREALVEKAETMSPKEFQKEVKELLMKLSIEDLLRVTDEQITEMTTETTVAEEAVTTEEISETVSWGWKTEWYRSPFREVTKQLKDDLTWETLAEPGIFPGWDGNQTRWNDFSAEETPMLVPEGGWLYFATGSYKLWSFDSEKNEKTDSLFVAPAAEERIYLTIVKGLPADGEDLNLNRIVMATDYVRGAGTYHDMPTAAYVSLDWFEQQIENAREESPGIESPNVGDNGAEEVIVVIIDLETQTVRAWKVIGPDNDDWQRVDENYL